MGTQRDHLTEWAQHLAARGWHVFPITPGAKKPPAIARWEQRATVDPERITRCWRAGAFNIGIATGPARLVVVDLDTNEGDGPDGAGQLARLAADRGVTVPGTWTVTTPSGGRHLYFTAPAGVRLRNTQGDLAPDVDTRAGGGYVVAPGSLVPGGGYELADDTDPVELPGWLLQALCEHRPVAISARPARPVATVTGYAAAAVAREAERVRTARPGQHNRTLSNAAYNLGQLVGAGLLDTATASHALTDAAHALMTGDCDCTPREIARVIRAGLAAGQARPRRGSRRKDAA